MDVALVEALIERDWPAFERVCRSVAIGTPVRHGTRIRIPCTPIGTDDGYVAVIDCDDYDAQAPLLDFADPDNPEDVGRHCWPRMQQAPYNNITIGARHVPILCVNGTRGYHLHPSHCAEHHDRSVWHLTATATLLHRLLHQWGPYVGRGV